MKCQICGYEMGSLGHSMWFCINCDVEYNSQYKTFAICGLDGRRIRLNGAEIQKRKDRIRDRGADPDKNGKEPEKERAFRSVFRELRNNKVVTLNDIEAYTGISRPTLRSYDFGERAIGKMQLDMVYSLAKYFGVSVDYIIERAKDYGEIQ
jgi:hypothetical protein